MINIVSSSRYKLDRKKIKKEAALIMADFGLSEEDVLNIIFVGKNKMRLVASKYKKEKEALPVLAFAYKKEQNMENEELPFGEIFICYPQAVLLAAEREKKVDNTILVLIKHGIENILQ